MRALGVATLQALLLCALLVAASAQDSRPASAPDEAAARRALTALAARHHNASTLRSRYVQLQSTALRKTPLESRGELLFRVAPPCIVFAVHEPREARIRLDESVYEVWRPDQKRLERFVLGSPDLPRGLFDSLLADYDRLARRLVLQSTVPVPGSDGLRIRMIPREEAMRPYLTAIELVVARDGSVLREVAYVDGQGDHVAIRLEALEIDPRLEERAFELTVPKDAHVLEHPASRPPTATRPLAATRQEAEK